MIDFSIAMVDSLRELPTSKNYSIVKFATDAAVVSSLANSNKTVKSLNKLVYSGGMTNLAGAISSCQETFSSSSVDEQKFILVITDGMPSVPDNQPQKVAETAATNAKGAGTFIIPVLIQDSEFAPETALAFMENISSDGSVFDVLDFEGLNSIQDSLLTQISCQSGQVWSE